MAEWNVGLPPAEYYDWDSPGLDELVNEVMKVPIVSLDTETTGLGRVDDIPLFWSMAWGNRRVCMHAHTLDLFQDAFKDPRKQWVLQNSKFDMHMLANVGIGIAGEVIDVMVMHSLLYEDMPHDLKNMSEQMLGWRWVGFDDTFRFSKAGKLTEQSTEADLEKGGLFRSVQDAILWCFHNDLSKLVEYASNDAYGTLQLYHKLEQELMEARTYSCMYPNEPLWLRKQISTLADMFFEYEVPFTKVLFNMERHGVLMDTEYLASLEGLMTEEETAIAREITKISSRKGYAVMNANSSAQMKHYWFDVCGYVPSKWTKGGKNAERSPSTDKDVVEYLISRYDDDVAKLHQERTKLVKVKGTYVTGIHKRLDKVGRIHTILNQHIAVTGRLSSSEPNLQNIKRVDEDVEEDKYNIRRAFIVPPGQDMIVADYKALEMRLLAIMANEPKMIEIFNKGWDIHMGNAALMYDLDYDDIKKAKKLEDHEWDALEPVMAQHYRHCLQARQDAKTVGFGQPERQAEVKLPQNGELFAARAA